MRNVIFLISRVSRLELNKLTFLLPHFIHKRFGLKPYVFSFESLDDLNTGYVYKGVELVVNSDLLSYVIDNNFSCDLFITIGGGWNRIPFVKSLRKITPLMKSMIYVDCSNRKIEIHKNIFKLPFYIRTYLLERKLGKLTFKNFDAMCVFGENEYQLVKENGYLHYNCDSKLHILPCGFDDENIFDFDCSGIKKEKMILYTGRIGDIAKHHDVIFDVLDAIPYLNGWKIVFIGPVDDNFKNEYDTYMQLHHRDNEFVLLPPMEKEELLSFYKKASVFILTSYTETYCYSLLEASLCKCLLLTTQVGIAPLLTEFGKYSLRINDLSSSVIEKVSYIINNSDNYNEMREKCYVNAVNIFSYSKIMDNSIFDLLINR